MDNYVNIQNKTTNILNIYYNIREHFSPRDC
jgi:hypothetical protein